MKRRKTSPKNFSSWEFVGAGIEDELHKNGAVIAPLRPPLSAKNPFSGNPTLIINYRSIEEQREKELNEIREQKIEKIICADLILAVITVAIEPKTLEIAFNDAKARFLADAFLQAFWEWPDLMPKVFQIARAKWHKENPTCTEIIQKFLVTNLWIKPDREKPPVINTREVQYKEVAEAIKIKLGRKFKPHNVRDAWDAIRLPKHDLIIMQELRTAINHLRSQGFCQFG